MPTLRARADIVYGYMDGLVNLTCEVDAEPPANFTWFRNGKRVFQTLYTIHEQPHASILEVKTSFVYKIHSSTQSLSTFQIQLDDESVLGDYRCRATNPLGSLDNVITLKLGIKPEPPSKFVLRGVNYDTLDVDVGAIRLKDATDMDIIGYRFEIIAVDEYKRNKRRWTTARKYDVPFEDEITYLLPYLSADTRYLVRAATRNLAGLSDFTQAKEFRTLILGMSNSLASGGLLQGVWMCLLGLIVSVSIH